MAGRMAQISVAAAQSRETTPASNSETGSEQSGKSRDHTLGSLHLELDDVFKLMDYLEKEGLQVLSKDVEEAAIARMKQKEVKPPPAVDSEAGILSRVRSNDPSLCPQKLDLSKSRFEFIFHFNSCLRSLSF
jgi:hypothetical protein